MLLEIKNLSLEYKRGNQIIPALKNISLILNAGENLGLVGESGCGKSSLALAILRLIDSREGKITSGSILWNGKNLLDFSLEDLRDIRGKEIAIVFQDPFSSLNPVMTVGTQIEEAMRCHNTNIPPKELKERALHLLAQVHIKESERICHSHPHQISGGQRQRALIAMAISNHPQLLICDEPTTALDVTIQKEILDLLTQLQKDLHMTILFITHHLGIIAKYSQRLAVLHGGEIVEAGETFLILKNPQAPYTQKLIAAIPKRKFKNGKIN